jgi:hypothetical protein
MLRSQEGAMDVRVGPTLQNPKKTAGKSKFWKILDDPVLQNSKKPRGETAIRDFLGSHKKCGTQREYPNFEPCSLQENRKEFLDKPILQNPETLRKKIAF